MDTETIRLIEEVKKYPELYDLSHINYLNPKWKDQLWDRIANELNLPDGKSTKNRWRKLRECHREALRRQEKKLELDATCPIRPWIYQKQMEFLRSHMRSGSNAPEFALKTVDESVCDNSTFAIIKEEVDMLSSDENSGAKRMKMSPSDDSSMDIKLFREDCDKEEENRKESTEKNHVPTQDKNLGLYHFFMAMYNITKNLPEKYQREVRRNIFESVYAAENACSTD